MPFQSEKQRRFLWAAHPEVAKRWAKDYPESNKGLPMYAPKKDDQLSDHSKAAAIAVLRSAMSNAANMTNLVNINLSLGRGVKLANSGMVKVPMPNSKQPTCAGEKPVTAKQNAPETADNAETPKQKDDAAVTALFGKLSAVLARPLREAIERMQAEDEARESRFVPENLGLRRYSAPSPSIMPPMGMAAAPGQPQPQPTAPPQAQAQAQPAQPANTPSNGPVGGGSNPQFNPINAFGAIGAKGQLNGNAAFGQKNSPDSLKIAAYNPALHKMLQEWEKTAPPVYSGAPWQEYQTGDPNVRSFRAIDTGLGPITQAKLSPELIQALRQHMKLRDNDTPDELDASHTLLDLDDAKLRAPGHKRAPATAKISMPRGVKSAYDWTGRRQSQNVEDLRYPSYKMPPLAQIQRDEVVRKNNANTYNLRTLAAGQTRAINPRTKAVDRFVMSLPPPPPLPPLPNRYGPQPGLSTEDRIEFSNLYKPNALSAAAPTIQKHLPSLPGPQSPIDAELGGMERYMPKTPLPTSDQIRQMPPLSATKTSAAQFGVKLAAEAPTEKISMPRGLGELPQGAGPDQIADAIMRFNQLRTLVRPTDETLRGHNLSRKGFQGSLRKITSHSQGKDRFDLNEMAPNPKLRAALTGLAGLGAAGGLAYTGNTDLALGALPATALAAGGAYLHGEHERGNVLNTARLMTQYGLLKPKLLQQAYPLLGDDYRVA